MQERDLDITYCSVETASGRHHVECAAETTGEAAVIAVSLTPTPSIYVYTFSSLLDFSPSRFPALRRTDR